MLDLLGLKKKESLESRKQRATQEVYDIIPSSLGSFEHEYNKLKRYFSERNQRNYKTILDKYDLSNNDLNKINLYNKTIELFIDHAIWQCSKDFEQVIIWHENLDKQRPKLAETIQNLKYLRSLPEIEIMPSQLQKLEDLHKKCRSGFDVIALDILNRYKQGVLNKNTSQKIELTNFEIEYIVNYQKTLPHDENEEYMKYFTIYTTLQPLQEISFTSLSIMYHNLRRCKCALHNYGYKISDLISDKQTCEQISSMMQGITLPEPTTK